MHYPQLTTASLFFTPRAAEEGLKKLQQMEEAFAKLKQVTGVKNVEEMHEKFSNQRYVCSTLCSNLCIFCAYAKNNLNHGYFYAWLLEYVLTVIFVISVRSNKLQLEMEVKDAEN